MTLSFMSTLQRLITERASDYLHFTPKDEYIIYLNLQSMHGSELRTASEAQLREWVDFEVGAYFEA